MKSAKFISMRIIGCTVLLVIIFLLLYSSFNSTFLGIFYSNSDNRALATFPSKNNTYTRMVLKPEVVLPKLLKGRARYDNQRILRIYDFYFVGSQWESLVNKYNICFATQASLDRIYWVPYILEKWTGPLSIAIQLISDEEWLMFNFYMEYLIKCHSSFQNQVAIHLAIPANLSALKVDKELLSQWEGISLETIWKKGAECPEAKQYLNYLLENLPTRDLRKLAYKEYYPQNHMRNIGRKGCGTHWTYSTDIDIIPVNGMADKLQQFYDSQKKQGKLCEKCAYVIPTFELNYTFPFPENKGKLVKYLKSRAAHPYHNNYPPSQQATEYKWWASHLLKEESVVVSHQINTTRLDHYEPYYLSSDTIAPFDERFLGYGSTRLSQFKAAYTAGWNFSVLTPVFSIHWGFLNSKTYEWPKKGGFGKVVRKEQFKKNKVIYEIFLKELECKQKVGTL